MTPSQRVYQALMVVYPAEHRSAYGEPMLQLFSDRMRRDGRGIGKLVVWIQMGFDLGVSAFKERMEEVMAPGNWTGRWWEASVVLLVLNNVWVGFAFSASGHPGFGFGLGFVPGAILLASLFSRSLLAYIDMSIMAIVSALAFVVASYYWWPLEWWMLYPIALAIPVILGARQRCASKSPGEVATA